MDTHEIPDLDSRIRTALKAAIRRSGKSREHIADELNRAHGLSVSVHTLNNWTGGKRERRVPAEVVPALCAVLGDDSLQRLLLDQEQIGKLELGECIAKWLDERFGPSKANNKVARLQRKTEHPAARTAGRP